MWIKSSGSGIFPDPDPDPGDPKRRIRRDPDPDPQHWYFDYYNYIYRLDTTKPLNEEELDQLEQIYLKELQLFKTS